ncbi:hypothetical protein BV902_01015 [Sphingobacterium sp. B29]|uniref:hypothetical protein n=1 Tax=Sphingobacterium sp. B29 TaxID=1933220 RepID=UPI000958B48F|nr:hypothetical protein [Sphingobacterium sp. B29]APU95081.1 hypothetical protein BV902_01015 [Sphingobacterium sp. B29]
MAVYQSEIVYYNRSCFWSIYQEDITTSAIAENIKEYYPNVSTRCWKRFSATWVIEGQKLNIFKLSGIINYSDFNSCSPTNQDEIIDIDLSHCLNNCRMHANWYTGKIYLVKNRSQIEHMDKDRIRVYVLTFVKGRLINEVIRVTRGKKSFIARLFDKFRFPLTN